MIQFSYFLHPFDYLFVSLLFVIIYSVSIEFGCGRWCSMRTEYTYSNKGLKYPILYTNKQPRLLSSFLRAMISVNLSHFSCFHFLWWPFFKISSFLKLFYPYISFYFFDIIITKGAVGIFCMCFSNFWSVQMLRSYTYFLVFL